MINRDTESLELDIEDLVSQEAINVGNQALGNNPPPKDPFGETAPEAGPPTASLFSQFVRSLNKTLGKATGGLTDPRTADMIEKARERQQANALDEEAQNVVSEVLDEQATPPLGAGEEGAPGATPSPAGPGEDPGGIESVDIDPAAVQRRIEQDAMPTEKRTKLRNLNIYRHMEGAQSDPIAGIEGINPNQDAQAVAGDMARVIEAVAQEIGDEHVPRSLSTLDNMTVDEVKREMAPFLAGGQKMGLMNDRQLYATRMVLATVGENVANLSGKITTGDATPEMLLNFQKAVKTHAALQSFLRGNVREVARALNQQNKIATTLSGGSLNDIDELMNVAHMTPEQLQQYAKVLDASIKQKGPIAGLKPSFMKRMNDGIAMAAEYWKASILSGPETHLVNMGGNAIYNAWENGVIRPVAGTIGFVRTGGKSGAVDRVYMGETMGAIAGSLAGLRDSMGITWRTLVKDESIFNTFGKGESQGLMINAAEGIQNPMGGKVARTAAKVASSPFRALQAEDDLFKTVAYRQEATALTLRQAYMEGLSGQEARDRAIGLMEEIPDDIHEQALVYAKNLTYTNTQSPGMLGAMGAAVKKLTAAYPILSFVTPFVNTPVNLMQRSIDMSILAGINPVLRKQLQAGGAQRDMALAKLTPGAAFTATAYHYFTNGMITGNGPSDHEQRKILEKTGWQANSILVDGKYIPYRRTDPFAASIAGLVDTLEAAQYSGKEADAAIYAEAALFGIARHMMDGTFLRGADDLFSILDGKKSMANYGSGILAGFVPLAGMQRSVAKYMDPQPRRTSDDKEFQTGFLYRLEQTVKKGVPGWTRELRPARHWDGTVAVPSPGAVAYAISPIKISKGKPATAVDKALIETGARIPEPDPMVTLGIGADAIHFSLVDLDKGEGMVYDQFFQRVGEARKQLLTDLVKDPGFKELTSGPGGGQKLKIQGALHQARGLGLFRFLSEDLLPMRAKDPEKFNSIAGHLEMGPEVLYARIQELAASRKAGIGLSPEAEEELGHARVGRGKQETPLPLPPHIRGEPDYVGFD